LALDSGATWQGGRMSDAASASESPVLVEVRGHVAVITLNRPDRLNAIT